MNSEVENLTNRKRGRPETGIQYPTTLTVRITSGMRDDLELIAAYEATKIGTRVRREVLDMIRRYQRNPQYKSWLSTMQSIKEKL